MKFLATITFGVLLVVGAVSGYFFYNYLSTVSQNSDLTCGGFRGVLCPDYTYCKVKDNFPDAMGNCAVLGVEIKQIFK